MVDQIRGDEEKTGGKERKRKERVKVGTEGHRKGRMEEGRREEGGRGRRKE